MDWNVILSLVSGLVSGFTGFLPVSSWAHQRLFLELTGTEGESLFRFACYLGSLAALILLCRPQLARFRRERKLAMIPARKRRRHPDQSALKEDRFFRTAMIPAIFITAVLCLVRPYVQSLWMIAILVALSGILLYLPQFFRRGNKNADNVSGLDALLIGASGAVAGIPGISGFAGMLCTASLRGVDRQFSADNGLMLFLGILPVLAGYELISLILAGGALMTAYWLLLYFLAAVAAFVGAWFAVQLVKFLAVRVGFSGMACYCWGQAIFTFALYLMI